MTIANRVMQFVGQLQADGVDVIALYVDPESKRLKVATPELPAQLVTQMLETASETYAAHERAKLN